MKHGWEIKKLGDICETSSGGTPSKSHSEYYEGGNIPWLRSGEISQGYIYETELYITEEGLKKSSAKIFPTDTVVIAMYGATVGQVGVLKMEMSTNQAVCGIYPTPMLSPLFLVYYLKAKKAYFLSLAAGGAQPNISQNIIKNTPIPIPPLAEQEKIVAELDCLSGIIEKKKQQLKEYDALAQSIFYEMFGNPIDNEKGWTRERLGNIGEIIAGSTPSTTDETNWGGEVNWVTPAELDVQLYYGETIRKITEKASKSLILMPIGTVLLSSRAPIGKIAITTVPMCCNQGFKNIICGNRVNNIFLYYYLMLTMDDIQALGRGATFKEVSKKSICDYKIFVPPVSLQQEFASKIEAIEKQKELIKQSITETEELFNSRMDYYFN